MKKTLYITLTALLGLMLSFLTHAFWEMSLINAALEKGIALQSNGHCFLPEYARILLPIFGISSGIFLGLRWWRIVYPHTPK